MATKQPIDANIADSSVQPLEAKAPRPKPKPKAPKQVETTEATQEPVVAELNHSETEAIAQPEVNLEAPATEFEQLLLQAESLLEAKDYVAAKTQYETITALYPAQIEGWQGLVISTTQNLTKYHASCLKPMQHVHALLTDTNRKAINKQYRLFLMNDDDLNLYGKSHIVLMILSLISFGMGVALLIIANKDWLPYLGALITLLGVLGFLFGVYELSTKIKAKKVLQLFAKK